jgi:hypothetical protein
LQSAGDRAAVLDVGVLRQRCAVVVVVVVALM